VTDSGVIAILCRLQSTPTPLDLLSTFTPIFRARHLILVGSLALAAAFPAAAAAQEPPLPGPPPGAGSGLPAPPTAGTPPAQQPTAPATTLQSSSGAPSLLNGKASLGKGSRRFSLKVFCKSNGQVRVTSPDVANGTFAKGSYKCRSKSGTASLKVSKQVAKRLTTLRSVVAQATLKQGGSSTRNSLTLQAGAKSDPADDFWTDGRLQCSPLGTTQPQSYVIAPNFTAKPAIVVSFRPWVAWYTPNSGWHWRGVRGERSSSWYNWTATPTGIAEWQVPGGGYNPWTWGPITVPSGQGTFAVAAFEMIYWSGGRPTWTWKYVKSGTQLPTGNYCNYP
jgi:hypothetical protein